MRGWGGGEKRMMVEIKFHSPHTLQVGYLFSLMDVSKAFPSFPVPFTENIIYLLFFSPLLFLSKQLHFWFSSNCLLVQPVPQQSMYFQTFQIHRRGASFIAAMSIC